MASLSAEILALLACPVCKAGLAFEQAGRAQEIRCLGCDRRYPVADGIPILIGERSTRD